MTPTTRILHLIHHDDQGGAPVAMVHQLRYFGTRCENFAVFGRGGDGRGGNPGRIETHCRAAGIPFATPWLGNKLLLPIAFVQTWRIIHNWRPDLVLLYGQWGAPIGALAAWMAGAKRCIYNSQWPAYYQDFTPLKAAMNALAEAVPARICRRIIALSPGNFHQYFIRGYDEADGDRAKDRDGNGGKNDNATPLPTKLVLLPNCTDTAAPSPESVAAWRSQWGWGVATDDVHVVSLGRLVPQKRMDWLMRAWALLQSKNRKSADTVTVAPPSHLWIVGGGDVQRYRDLARRLGIADNCTLTGFDPEGWKRLAAADIFALTSRSEGLPFVVLEAMAAGVPTIASRVDGIEGTVRDGQDGILVGPTDLQGFADALDKLIRDASLRRRLGASARLRSRDFECATVLPKYEVLYNEVLNEPV